MSLLLAYDYPGNIRELKSVIHSAVNLAQGKPVSVNCLPDQVQKQKSQWVAATSSGSEPVLALAEVEKTHILKAYNRMHKNKSRTARLLGIGLNTLRRKLDSYGVS